MVVNHGKINGKEQFKADITVLAHFAETSLSKIFLKHQIICWSIATEKEIFNKETTTELILCMTEFKFSSYITAS